MGVRVRYKRMMKGWVGESTVHEEGEGGGGGGTGLHLARVRPDAQSVQREVGEGRGDEQGRGKNDA